MSDSIPERPSATPAPTRRPNLVQFDIARWRFSAPLVPILCAVLILPVLLSLGFWQLDRAAQRIALIASVEEARNQPARAVDDPELRESTSRYTPVAVHGRVDEARQFLLDNRVNGKVVGYEVLAPIIYKPGHAVLVNRGWLPVGVSRRDKPDVSVAPDQGDRIELTGLAAVPPERFSLGAALTADDGWPRVLQFEDFDAIGTVLGLDVLPRIVQPGQLDWGYESVWQPVEKGPEQNYAYALQWFALALTLFIIIVVVCVRRRPEAL